jgi:hypothetical protein
VPDSLADRLELVEKLLADPPVVHPMQQTADPELGVWSTDADCYRFIAERCSAGSRTLETGSGLSTTLFAALGTRHHCVTPGTEERDRIVAYCRSHGYPTDDLVFDLGSSHTELPRLQQELDGLDLVLVDGGHGFPLPIIDWFYAAPLLVPGGILVVDDLMLPAVKVLRSFLDPDPRWERIAGSDKWGAYRRLDDGDLVEDWFEQPFFEVHDWTARGVVRRARGKAAFEWARVSGAVRGR